MLITDELLQDLRVDPITSVIGAEVSGVDLRNPLDADDVERIRHAIRQWRVLVFAGQDLNDEQLKVFGRAFGNLTVAHPVFGGMADHPEVFEQGDRHYDMLQIARTLRSPAERPPRDTEGWHIDCSFAVNPSRYTILYGVRASEYGGDTMFADLAAAYRGLSLPIQKLVDALTLIHTRSPTTLRSKTDPGSGASGSFITQHPLVSVHGETGEKLLFLNPEACSHIVGLEERESRALVDLLEGHIKRPEYTMRLRWRPDMLVMIDNHAVAHNGPIGRNADQARLMHRIMVSGGSLQGPGGFVSKSFKGGPLQTVE